MLVTHNIFSYFAQRTAVLTCAIRLSLGPITGSVFIRDTTNCRFVIACQQFRTRDCKDIDCLLLCNTLPIIEATSSIRFGCFRGSYFTLAGQFSKSGISLYNNNWGKIHDFTPETGNKNFSFLDRTPGIDSPSKYYFALSYNKISVF